LEGPLFEEKNKFIQQALRRRVRAFVVLLQRGYESRGGIGCLHLATDTGSIPLHGRIQDVDSWL